VSGTDLYVGGLFEDAGGVANADKIAKWNGTSWSALGTGLNDYADAIVISGTDVWVAGNFTTASGVANTKRVARWDGATWNALGAGLNGYTVALALGANNLYAGGEFTATGDNAISLNHIGRYETNLIVPTRTPTVTLTPTATETRVATETPTTTHTPTATATSACTSKPPKPLKLLKPKNGAQIETTSPKLKWTPTACSASAKVFIVDSATGQVLKFNAATNGSFQVPPQKLQKGHSYQWYVKACNQFGCSARSEKRTFTVEP